jgi:hypothetical protein
MKLRLIPFLLVVCAMTVTDANARTRSDRCWDWADQQVRATTTTPARGAARGAAVGALGGAVFGNAGVGAAAGAGLGAARRAGQRNRNRQFFYDQCMGRR